MKFREPYREFTFGWIILAFIVPTFALITFLFITGSGDRPLTTPVFIVVSSLVLISGFLFYGMTTEIKGEEVIVSFGIGLIRKRIPMSRIKSAEPVSSPWYYGWGIRMIPNGMMFNISGFESVELRFNDSKRVFRIGTPNPDALSMEIKHRLGNRTDRTNPPTA